MDNDGRAIRCSQWYGASGPDEGLRLPDSKIAEGIIEREVKMGLCTLENPSDLKSARWPKQVIRYAGPDCFQKRPNYMGGGQGPSTSEIFSLYGIHLNPGDPKRELKIRQFRERLVYQDANKQPITPMMLIYKTCEEFFSTISSLVMDKLDPEDVDSKGEDHIYDEVCHICMARPIGAHKPAPRKTNAQRIIDSVEQRFDEEALPWAQASEPGEGGFDGERW